MQDWAAIAMPLPRAQNFIANYNTKGSIFETQGQIPSHSLKEIRIRTRRLSHEPNKFDTDLGFYTQD